MPWRWRRRQPDAPSVVATMCSSWAWRMPSGGRTRTGERGPRSPRCAGSQRARWSSPICPIRPRLVVDQIRQQGVHNLPRSRPEASRRLTADPARRGQGPSTAVLVAQQHRQHSLCRDPAVRIARQHRGKGKEADQQQENQGEDPAGGGDSRECSEHSEASSDLGTTSPHGAQQGCTTPVRPSQWMRMYKPGVWWSSRLPG